MTLNFAQTPEELALAEAEADLHELHQEREEYLEAAADPRTPLPYRGLSDIRDATEIAEARLESAKKAAAKAAVKRATPEEVQRLLTEAQASRTETLKRVETASQAMASAVATLAGEIQGYNDALSRARQALVDAGIPVEGAELDGEPIDLTEHEVTHGSFRYPRISGKALPHFLIAAAATDYKYPSEPFGWNHFRNSYLAGTYWQHTAFIN